MANALFSSLSALGLSPGQEHCVVFLGKTLYSHSASLRVRTGPGKPGKSWNFIMAFSSSPGKRPLVLESSGNLLNSGKNKCLEGSKEN